jgi:hypothetical protein
MKPLALMKKPLALMKKPLAQRRKPTHIVPKNNAPMSLKPNLPV